MNTMNKTRPDCKGQRERLRAFRRTQGEPLCGTGWDEGTLGKELWDFRGRVADLGRVGLWERPCPRPVPAAARKPPVRDLVGNLN